MDILRIRIRHILKSLARAPIFTTVTVLTLALSIGGTTAIFSVVECVLLNPLPYPHPEELVAVKHSALGWGFPEMGVAPTSYFTYREHSHTFQDIGLFTQGINAAGMSVSVTGLGDPENVPAVGVTDGVLPILGAKPLFGRAFSQQDETIGSPDTAMLTYNYWRRKFNADRSIVGKRVDVDNKPRLIIGVLPQTFQFPAKPNLAIILPIQLDRANSFMGQYIYGGIARLKPGVTISEADADVARMMLIEEKIFTQPPGVSMKERERGRIKPLLKPLKTDVIGDASKTLWILMAGMCILLAIACANVANLFLIRAEASQQEVALRAALGSSRRRLAIDHFLESLILSISGGLLGFALAYGILQVLIAIVPPGLPRITAIGIDARVALFTLLLSLGVSLFLGLVRISQYSGTGFGSLLREGGRSMSAGVGRQRFRGLLVVTQMAFALVLLLSCGLMIRSLVALMEVNPGFVDPSHIQTFRIAVREVKNPEQVLHIEESIAQKLQTVEGVVSVGVSRDVPMDGGKWTDPLLVKDYVETPGQTQLRRFVFVSPDYLKTLGTPMVFGRCFTDNDIDNNVPVVMVSERFARQYWGAPAAAIGKQLRVTSNENWHNVIGVVGNVRQDGMDKESPPTVYWPLYVPNFEGAPAYSARTNVIFTMRTQRAGTEALMRDVKRAVWAVRPDMPVAEAQTLEYYYARSMATTRFTLAMLGASGSIALLLGVIGLYGVIAYSVSRRKREIGIRMALGAQRSDIVRLILGQAVILIFSGVIIGVAVALGITRFIAGLLYNVRPIDPLTFVIVVPSLVAIALVASYLFARQTAQEDPMTAIRHE